MNTRPRIQKFDEPLCPRLWITLSVFFISIIALTPNCFAADSLRIVELAAPAQMRLELVSPQRASLQQKALFQSKLQGVRTHHLVVPTRASFAPYATSRSTNKQIVRSRNEALLSDGIAVIDKVPASTRAKMDYNYVSPIAEPSSAIVRDNIIVTFNWGAIWSSDAGKSFSQLSPFSLFDNPKPALGNEFCCDQAVVYAASHDLLIWLMQGSDDNHGNTVRLLFAKGGDIESRNWKVHDFSPASIGNWTNEWFDFPDIALTEKNLVVTFNSFRPNQAGYSRSVVLRFPLDQLASYGSVKVAAFSSDSSEDFSPRLTHGADGRIFWATHRDESTLVVRSWADDMAQPDHRRLVDVERYTLPNDSTVQSSKGPNGKPWLNRLDDRITAGWMTNDTVGFAWSSGSISASQGGAAYPFAHIRVAIIKKDDLLGDGDSILSPIEQPHIWSSNFATAYVSAAPNDAGDIGLSLFFGGPKHYPSSAVGVLQRTNQGWRSALTILTKGVNTPKCPLEKGFNDSCGTWGDYLNIRKNPSNKKEWLVAAQTAQDTGALENPKVVVSFARFAVKQKPNPEIATSH